MRSRIDPGAPWRRAGVACFALAVACAGRPSIALAQEVPSADRAIEFEDLGFTRSPEISARGAGLSGYVATTNDVSALITNPALLCRIKQRTPMLGLSHESQEIVTTYSGVSSGL